MHVAGMFVGMALRRTALALVAVITPLSGAALAQDDSATASLLARREGHVPFSRDEILIGTRALSHAYMKLLADDVADAHAHSPLAERIEHLYAHVLPHVVRLRPDAGVWGWRLVLLANRAVPPFAMPDGQIFVATEWVEARQLADAEIALLLAHEMAHVIADHTLERIAALAATRPAPNLSVSDVLQIVQEQPHLMRDLEPLMRGQEFDADRIGILIVCSAGIVPSQALTLFDKMARTEGLQSVSSHGHALVRKAQLIKWMTSEKLACATGSQMQGVLPK